MSDLASLFIRVDSKGVVTASKDLNKLTDDSKKTETATEGVTRGFSKLQAVVVALASSYVLLKMAQYIKDAAMLAARYETLGVVMRVVGNNAGYTGAQMDKFARGLQKSGIAMVESRNTLARMIQAQIDLTSSQKLARIAQDAAVIGNMNSSAAFEHMIYGLQTGHPRILRTIGLNVDFDASVRALAVSLGIEKDALTEAQIMQGRVNAVMKSGVLIQGTYEAAMGTAGKKLTSFTRYVEDFKVKMGEAFGPATVMLVDAATQAMKDMQEQISRPEAQEALRELSSQLAEIIVKIGKDLPKAIETMAAAVGVLADAFAEIVNIWTHPVWDKMDKFFGIVSEKEWQEGMMAVANKISPEFHKISESMDKFLSQYEKMQEMLAKGTPIKLDFALEDPDKYFGKMIPEKLMWEKEDFESIEKWYKWIEKEAQENLASMIEIEDEETRMFEENLNYRLVVKQQYYKDIETAAQEARDFDEEMEDQVLRMAKETADYQEGYIDKLAEAASYYKDLTGFEDTYHEKMLELIEARRKAEIDANKDVTAANAKALKARNELAEEAYDTEIRHIKSQWKGYSDMFGGLSQLYDEDSSERKRLHDISMAFQVAEQAIMLVTAVRAAVIAIATQGQGDPYTAFARVAAMAGLMAATLSKAGISFGGGGGGGGVFASSLPASTVLGAEAGTGSQSIANAWELLEDTYDMEYRELSGIHSEMKDMNDNISGLVASIFRTGGINKISEWDIAKPTTGLITEILTFGLDEMGKIGDFISGDFLLGMSDTFTKWATNLTSSIFGGGTKTSITEAGISIDAASIGSLAGGGIDAQQYADIKKTTEGGWFHSDKTKRYTKYQALDENVTRLLDKVFQNMGDTLIELTLGLGTDMNATLNYVFEDAKINLKGMDSDEINDTLIEYFSALGDTAVDALFGNLIGIYQEVGEGMMETAARILIDKAVILDILEMTGQAFTGTVRQITGFGGVIGDILGQAFSNTTSRMIAFSETIIDMAGGLETLRENAKKYYDKFFSDEEKQIRLQEQLTGVLSDLNMALPDVRDGYRALIEGLDLTTEAGQEAYVTLLALAESTDTYYSTLEQLAENRTNLKIQLMELQGNTAEALAAQRAIELDSLNASLRPLQTFIYALQDLNKANEEAARIADRIAEKVVAIAKQQRSLDIRLMDAMGDASGALTARRIDELAAIDVSLWPLQQRLYYLEDEAVAAATVNERMSMQIKLLETQGKSEDALIIKRQLEIDVMDATSQILQRQIWVQEEMNRVLAATISTAMSAVDAQIVASSTAANTARQAAKSYEVVTDSLQTAIDSIRGLTSSSGAGFKSLYDKSITGDIKSLTALPGSATAYLESAKASSESAIEYKRAEGKVLQMLNNAMMISIAETNWNEYQATLLEVQTGVLEDIRETLMTPSIDTELLNQQIGMLGTIADLLDNQTTQIVAGNNTQAIITIDQTGKITDVQSSINLGTASTTTSLSDQTTQIESGNVTQSAIEDISNLNTTYSAAMLSELVSGSSIQNASLSDILTKNNQTVTALNQLIALIAQQLTAQAAAAVQATADMAAAAAQEAQDRAAAAAVIAAATAAAQAQLAAEEAARLATEEAAATVTAYNVQVAIAEQYRSQWEQFATSRADDIYFRERQENIATGTQYTVSGYGYEDLSWAEQNWLNQLVRDYRAAFDEAYRLLQIIPGHASGLNRVPHDDYLMSAHKGEAVLTAPQAAEWRSGKSGSDVSKDQTEELRKIRQAIEAGNFASVKNSNKIAKILARFDDDGMPAERSV